MRQANMVFAGVEAHPDEWSSDYRELIRRACFAVARRPVEDLVSPSSHPSIGVDIQGPSLVRVPDWVDAPLGRYYLYYLYFADHKGRYIRLAYADRLDGPGTVHVPGALHLEDTPFPRPREPLEVSADRLKTAVEGPRLFNADMRQRLRLRPTRHADPRVLNAGGDKPRPYEVVANTFSAVAAATKFSFKTV